MNEKIFLNLLIRWTRQINISARSTKFHWKPSIALKARKKTASIYSRLIRAREKNRCFLGILIKQTGIKRKQGTFSLKQFAKPPKAFSAIRGKFPGKLKCSSKEEFHFFSHYLRFSRISLFYIWQVCKALIPIKELFYG